MLSKRELEMLANGTAKFTQDMLAPIKARLDALEAGGAKSLIEAYQGVHKQGQRYEQGSLVTHQGGLWFAQSDTETRPGSGPHWILAVKSGGR